MCLILFGKIFWKMKNKISLFLLVLFPMLSFAQLSSEEKQTRIDEIVNRIQLPEIPEVEVSVLDYGAKPNSAKDSKKAFDKAIKSLQKKGGGKLIVPKGEYQLEGPIHLISNMELHLAEGVLLNFGTNPKDYPMVLTSWEGTMLYNYSPLIYGNNLKNVAITGSGTINGNGKEFWQSWKSKEDPAKQKSREMNHNSTPLQDRQFGEGNYLRPQLLQLVNSENILIEDIRIENAPFWCVHLLKCKSATLRGLSYDSHNSNNDGIDLEYTSDVLIEDVTFDNGDDNVAIKAGRDDEGRANAATPSENIVMRNCLLKGLHAFVIGSEMSAGVRNVFVQNCKAHGYLKRGIYFKTNPDRGGYIKDIYIDNLKFDKTEDLFYITSFYHGEGEGHISKISDIYINNIKCEEVTGTAVVIQGFEDSKVESVQLQNIKVKKAKNGTSITNTKNVVVDNLIIGEEAGVPTAAGKDVGEKK